MRGCFVLLETDGGGGRGVHSMVVADSYRREWGELLNTSKQKPLTWKDWNSR